MPKVSIIVPIYNTEPYLKTCLKSILSQTFNDFELLLVDDGSSDGSGKICDEYAKRDTRIKVFHTKNQGSAMARNVGLDNAKCDIISMIDSDDYVPPSYLSTLLTIMEETNADIVGHMFKGFYHDDEVFGLDIPKFSSEDIVDLNQEEALTALVLEYTTALIVPSKLYRKKVFENFRYPNVQKNDDEWAIHHLIANAKKIVLLKERIYYYRFRQNSQTRKFSLGDYSGVLAQLDRAKFIEANGYSSLCVDAYRSFFLKSVMFYYKCLKEGNNPQNVISNNQKELHHAYKKCRFFELEKIYSKRDIIALYLFSRSITAFKLFTKLIHIEIV